MSMANSIEQRLQFGLHDRLGKALNVAGVTNSDMAEYLGVSPTTIGNYTSGRTHPKKQTLRLWAMRTGVPLEWLETGTVPAPKKDPEITERNLAPVTYLADRRKPIAATAA